MAAASSEAAADKRPRTELGGLQDEHVGQEAEERYRQEWQSALPFPSLVVPNVLDPRLVEEVADEVTDQPFEHRHNDLHEFLHAGDLTRVDSPAIKRLREVLYGARFRDWLSRVTGITGLAPKPDMSGHLYYSGGTLLCHDDRLEGRRIAYVLYMVAPGWQADDGGCLEMFDTDPRGDPGKVVRRVAPQWNQMALFQVSERSFHQVGEVLSESKQRVSVSGWFHGPGAVGPVAADAVPRALLPAWEPMEVRKGGEDGDGASLATWVDERYWKTGDVAAQLSAHFRQESSVELHQFLREEQWARVRRAAAARVADDMGEHWTRVGPANRLNYRRWAPKATPAREPDAVDELAAFVRGREFHKWLQSWTGVTNVGAARPVEMRRFDRGDYTLLYDGCQEPHAVLECSLGLVADGAAWADGDATGGYTQYQTEDEELLRLTPAPNALAVVYRAAGEMAYVKFVNHHAPEPRLDMFLVLRDDDDDDGVGDGDDQNGN